MMKYLFLFFFFCAACKKGKQSVYDFRLGCFRIPKGEGYEKTLLIRKDTLQIEYYGLRVDTLFIRWKDRFNYELLMKHPRTALDKKPIKVKITKVLKGGYEFAAKIGESRFEQAGVIYKEPCWEIDE